MDRAIQGGEVTMLNLIYIGEDFYFKSQTMMSSIYTRDGKRSDWGRVQVALQAGEEVYIRHATPNELQFYQDKLSAFLKLQAKED